MRRLPREGTAEPVSRDQILRREREQGNIHFLCSFATKRIGKLTWLIHTLLNVMAKHTYWYIHTMYSNQECTVELVKFRGVGVGHIKDTTIIALEL